MSYRTDEQQDDIDRLFELMGQHESPPSDVFDKTFQMMFNSTLPAPLPTKKLANSKVRSSFRPLSLIAAALFAFVWLAAALFNQPVAINSTVGAVKISPIITVATTTVSASPIIDDEDSDRYSQYGKHLKAAPKPTVSLTRPTGIDYTFIPTNSRFSSTNGNNTVPW